jgi:hypothetical protein
MQTFTVTISKERMEEIIKECRDEIITKKYSYSDIPEGTSRKEGILFLDNESKFDIKPMRESFRLNRKLDVSGWSSSGMFDDEPSYFGEVGDYFNGNWTMKNEKIKQIALNKTCYTFKLVTVEETDDMKKPCMKLVVTGVGKWQEGKNGEPGFVKTERRLKPGEKLFGEIEVSAENVEQRSFEEERQEDKTWETMNETEQRIAMEKAKNLVAVHHQILNHLFDRGQKQKKALIKPVSGIGQIRKNKIDSGKVAVSSKYARRNLKEKKTEVENENAKRAINNIVSKISNKPVAYKM